MKNSPTKKQKESPKYGDIFRIGDRGLLACGDARDEALVKKVVGGKKIAAVIVDVPYGIKAVESKEGFGKITVQKKILNDDIDTDASYVAFTEAWIKPLLPHLTKKNNFYIFNADPMVFALRQGMLSAGLTFSQLLIWVKTGATLTRKDYAVQHELIAVGWFGTHAFRATKDRSILVYPKPARSPLHASQKPVGLIRRLILNTTNPNDIVCDPFAGSGTLGVAAFETQRSFILIERDEAYVQTIIDRFARMGVVTTSIHEKR
jgi:DNA modification methylase